LVKIKVIWVGKTKEEWIKEGIWHYKKLLKKYAELQLVEIKEEKITTSKDAEHILKVESDRILKHMDKSTLGVALDVSGRLMDSETFANLLEDNLNRGYGELTFIIGGALGLSPQVLNICNVKISLSPMTFTHEMSRIILLEQIYRALSILKGAKYHK
jgi:23S rRNA (pseudouridine1915-N3)-methyltransferase